MNNVVEQFTELVSELEDIVSEFRKIEPIVDELREYQNNREGSDYFGNHLEYE